ncbi:MAG: hypothetical protein ACKPKO_58510, partial [Candidatus Fonsibacter sp.]
NYFYNIFTLCHLFFFVLKLLMFFIFDICHILFVFIIFNVLRFILSAFSLYLSDEHVCVFYYFLLFINFRRSSFCPCS